MPCWSFLTERSSWKISTKMGWLFWLLPFGLFVDVAHFLRPVTTPKHDATNLSTKETSQILAVPSGGGAAAGVGRLATFFGF